MRTATKLWVSMLAATASLVMYGCQTQPKPLYHWGDYQPAVYSHLKGEAAEGQQLRLEQTAHKAQSLGEPVPPGFNAHLGLLYLNTGQLDKARGAFEAEAELFPESRHYMSFLLNNFTKPTAGISP